MLIMAPGVFPDTAFPDRCWIDDVWADFSPATLHIIRGVSSVLDPRMSSGNIRSPRASAPTVSELNRSDNTLSS